MRYCPLTEYKPSKELVEVTRMAAELMHKSEWKEIFELEDKLWDLNRKYKIALEALIEIMSDDDHPEAGTTAVEALIELGVVKPVRVI